MSITNNNLKKNERTTAVLRNLGGSDLWEDLFVYLA